MPCRHLLFETDGAGIALVTFSHPEKRHALSAAALCAATGDRREGTRAFLEKRRPVFTGR